MGKDGIFRSAIGGFNKKDVLGYIDQITGEWDAERQELTQTAAKAQEEAAMQASVAEAQAATVAAMQTQLEQLQETLAEVTATAQAVPALREQVDLLGAENEQIRRQLRDAEQAHSERAATLQREIQTQNGQLAEYRALLGESRSATAHVQHVVRPMIEDTSRRAAETLDAVQATISTLLTQLGDLQRDVAARQQMQRDAAAGDAARLAESVDRWLDRANRLAPDRPVGGDTHFFR